MRKINNSLKSAEHMLWYKQPAENFNEALPIGNGRIGACVYGGINEETISLNEDTLWSGYPKEILKENYPDTYKKAAELVNCGKKTEAQRLLEENFGDYLVQVYLPLGNLKIKQPHTGRISGYRRELRIDKALHRVIYRCGGKEYIRECFVSCDAQVLVVHFSCSQGASINFSAWLESQLKCSFETQGSLVCMSGNAPECVAGFGDMYKTTDYQIYSDDPSQKGMGFAAAMSVKINGGNVQTVGKKIFVSDADDATLYISLRTAFEGWNKHPSYSSKDYRKQCFADLNETRKILYFDLVNENIAAHKTLYERCEISLKNSKNSRLPTDRRLEAHAQGAEDNSLYALLFNYGRYLTIASSREGTQPSNLQGIWNEKLLPPWNSNYTLNINTEMNYWPCLACGLFECYEPLIKMAEELAESGKITAKTYYGADGWVCHHSSDIWRVTHPATNRLNNNAQWGFWNMSSGWISVMLWNYFRYTLDKEYLKRIYPVIEGAALFYKQLLTEKNGELVLSPSTSPENNYIENSETHAVDTDTAMTQEILFDLFSAVGEAQEILGLENKYSDLASRLKRPRIQSDGLLCEWGGEYDVWDVNHRHVSHLYGLFPSNQFTDEQKRASVKTLKQRGDGGTGWSLAWKINLWARLGDGEHALKLLDNQLKPVPSECDTADRPGGSYPNLFCAHPPFQIDGNFGAASGIIEMLVQADKDGNPVLLPALPEKWKEGRVKGMVLPGGKKVSFSWEDGKILNYEEN